MFTSSIIIVLIGIVLWVAFDYIWKDKKDIKWKEDNWISKEFDRCDILKQNIDYLNYFEKDKIDKLPFLVSGVSTTWPAFELWKKDNFLSNYGNKSINVGSETSIVMGGGTVSFKTNLSEILNSFNEISRNNYQNMSDFIFDTAILKYLPELKNDINIPKRFQSWDSNVNEQKRIMWHMLSLGMSRSGLPFHAHGKTWITVIHGKKLWFFYPPGITPANPSSIKWMSMFPVYFWVKNILPTLLSFPKLDIINLPMTSDKISKPYQPIVCLQKEGDLLYLPDGWNHLTINVGETIAFGGQSSYFPSKRYHDAKELLQLNPNDIESLKSLALSGAHLLLEQKQNILKSLHFQGNIITFTSIKQMHRFHQITENTFIVLRITQDSCSSVKLVPNPSSERQYMLFRDIINVWIDLSNHFDNQLDFVVLLSSPPYPTMNDYCDISKLEFILYPGRQQSTNPTENIIYHRIQIEQDLVTSISDFITLTTKQFSFLPGSVRYLPMSLQEQYQEVIRAIKLALSLEPYQLECWRLLAEVYGNTGQIQKMKEIIAEAVSIYSKIESSDISRKSLVAIFHQLGTSFLSINLIQEALSLFDLAMQYDSLYPPVLVDRIIAASILPDKSLAKQYLKVLENLNPSNEMIPILYKNINSM